MRILAIALLCLLTRAAPAHGSGADWSAWLYDAESGHLALVAADGLVVRDLYVPLSQGFNQLPENVAFSRSGVLLAFVAANTDTDEHQLVVHDTTTQFQKLLVNLPDLTAHSLSPASSQNAFNDNDMLLAFGFTSGDGWRMDVYDLATGAVAYTLLDEATSAYEAAGDEGQPLVPVIRRFEGTQITFSLDAGEPQERTSSFTWDFLTSSLIPAPAYSRLDLDAYAPTGELVMAGSDADLPNQAGSFSTSQNNVLMVYSPRMNSRFPFYNDPERSLFWPHFVQNGERIFVAGTTPDSDAAALFLIERDGTVISAVSVPGITGVGGLTDGLFYGLERPGEQGSAASLMYVNTRAGETLEGGTPVWTSAPNTEYRIVWAHDQRQAETAAFMEWAQLAEPVVVGE